MIVVSINFAAGCLVFLVLRFHMSAKKLRLHVLCSSGEEQLSAGGDSQIWNYWKAKRPALS